MEERIFTPNEIKRLELLSSIKKECDANGGYRGSLSKYAKEYGIGTMFVQALTKSGIVVNSGSNTYPYYKWAVDVRPNVAMVAKLMEAEHKIYRSYTDRDEIVRTESIVFAKKKCCRCKEEKPIDEFYNMKKSADGKQSICIDCMKKAMSGRRKKITKLDNITNDKVATPQFLNPVVVKQEAPKKRVYKKRSSKKKYGVIRTFVYWFLNKIW